MKTGFFSFMVYLSSIIDRFIKRYMHNSTHSSTSVSYTHLDVYKRQAVYRPTSLLDPSLFFELYLDTPNFWHSWMASKYSLYFKFLRNNYYKIIILLCSW